MGFFDLFGKKVQDVGDKTKELVDITNNKNMILDRESQIKQMYMRIGEVYFDIHHDDPEQELSPYVYRITAIKKEIADLEDKNMQLKGFVKCPHCGEYTMGNQLNCTSCGQRIVPDDIVVCPHCNSFEKKGMKFCSRCGKPMTIVPTPTPTPVPMPRTCPNCHSELIEGAAFCMSCGEKIQPIPVVEEPVKIKCCSYCGKELIEGAAFCMSCGERVGSVPPVTQEPTGWVNEPAAPETSGWVNEPAAPETSGWVNEPAAPSWVSEPAIPETPGWGSEPAAPETSGWGSEPAAPSWGSEPAAPETDIGWQPMEDTGYSDFPKASGGSETKKFCEECGAQLIPGNKYCLSCGAEI